jgi:hypothetical protein
LKSHSLLKSAGRFDAATHLLLSRAMIRPMPHKPARKPKLTDAERHKRFVDMAEKVMASHDPKDFDKAFKKVVAPKRSQTGR